MMNARRTFTRFSFGVMGAVVFAGGLMSAGLAGQTMSKAPMAHMDMKMVPKTGQKAPDFSLTALDGTTVRLSTEVARGPVVLVVLRGWPGYERASEPALARSVRQASAEIVRRKGATNHAIGLVTAHLLKWALRDEGRVMCVSRIQNGPLGLHDVALSLPARIGKDGAQTVSTIALDAAEREALERSAAILRAAKASVAPG